MTTPTLMATLRSATAMHHARTEALVPVLDPALDLVGYGGILLRFSATYTVLERMLAEVPRWPGGFDMRAGHRSALLERDLAWLHARGAIPHESLDVAAASSAGVTPTLPEAIGIAYVLEGASLGGQVILRHLGPRLGISATEGASFYAGEGAGTGRRWRAFGAMVDQWGEENRGEWEAVVESARRTFEMIATPFSLERRGQLDR